MQLTKREIFDKVKTHLLTQNAKSLKGDRCMYRGEENRTCAVGCLISDEAYSKDLEDLTADDEDVLNALEKSGIVITDNLSYMLNALQSIHDNCGVEHWQFELEKLEQRLFHI